MVKQKLTENEINKLYAENVTEHREKIKQQLCEDVKNATKENLHDLKAKYFLLIQRIKVNDKKNNEEDYYTILVNFDYIAHFYRVDRILFLDLICQALEVNGRYNLLKPRTLNWKVSLEDSFLFEEVNIAALTLLLDTEMVQECMMSLALVEQN